jgi:hypothetical protein
MWALLCGRHPFLYCVRKLEAKDKMKQNTTAGETGHKLRHWLLDTRRLQNIIVGPAETRRTILNNLPEIK